MVGVLGNKSYVSPPLPGGSLPQEPGIAATATNGNAVQDEDDEGQGSQNNASNSTIAQHEDTKNCTLKEIKPCKITPNNIQSCCIHSKNMCAKLAKLAGHMLCDHPSFKDSHNFAQPLKTHE